MTTDKSKTATKKNKVIRDSFTIPKAEYATIDELKNRAVRLGTSVKKSELLRAGLMALQALNDAAYKRALAVVPALKTGRPAADTKATPKPVPTPSPARAAAKKSASTQPETQKPASPTVKAQPAVKTRAAKARVAKAPYPASAPNVADQAPAKA